VGTYWHCWHSPHGNQSKLPEEYVATEGGKGLQNSEGGAQIKLQEQIMQGRKNSM